MIGKFRGIVFDILIALGLENGVAGFLEASNNLSDVSSASTSRTNLGLGTAAVLDAGTASGNLVQLDATGLPAVDGSQLTNLPGGGGGTVQGTDGTYDIRAAADGATAGSTARGENSVDLQTHRTAGTQVAAGTYSAILSGTTNQLVSGSTSSVICGGSTISMVGTTFQNFMGGGFSNVITNGSLCVVAGGRQHAVSGSYQTVCGGYFHTVSGVGYATVCGGDLNQATGSHSFVGGGDSNTATNTGASVLGGLNNDATGLYSSVAGGRDGTASGDYSFVTGRSNTASGAYSAVTGQSNTASGSWSAAGGQSCTAAGDWSLAYGQNSEAGASAAQDHAFAFGYLCQAYASRSMAIGEGARTFAEGSIAHALSTTSGGVQREIIPETVDTADATPTPLMTYTGSDNSGFFVEAEVWAITQNGNDGAEWQSIRATWRHDGTAALLLDPGTAIAPDTNWTTGSPTPANWRVGVTVSSGGVLTVTVTGEASTAIRWGGYLKIKQIRAYT